MSNALSSKGSLAYQGTNAPMPPNITVHYRAPTSNNYQNFSIGDLWIYRVSSTTNDNELWILMGLVGNVANWVLLSNSIGALLTLTGNSGGAVGPTLGNINILGASGINVVGSPGTSTLTISPSGGSIVSTLTGNSGGAVSPTAGNINVVGDTTTITIVGNPGTSTLTASTTGTVATSYPTDSGTAIPAAGVLDVFGDSHNVTTTGSGHQVTVGLTGITQHSLQVGGASQALTQLGVATNGQLPIGSTGVDPVLATITQGTGITVTNGAGSITIAATNTNPASTNSFFAYNSAMRSAFFAYLSTTTVEFDTAVFNNGSHYNTGTYTYTAPATGLYFFSYGVSFSNAIGTDFREIAIVLVTTSASYGIPNYSAVATEAVVTTGATSVGFPNSIFCPMSSGDTAYVSVVAGGSALTSAQTLNLFGGALADCRTYFSGYQVA